MKVRIIILLCIIALTGCKSNNTAEIKQNMLNLQSNESEFNTGLLGNEKDSLAEVSTNDENQLNDPSKNPILILEELIPETYSVNEYQDYEIIHLEEAKYLLGVRDDYNSNLNYWYSYHDFDDHTNVRIDGIHQLIRNIYYEDDKVIFKCSGSNSVNAFKSFPKTYIFDTTTFELSEEVEYINFQSFEGYPEVGGNINASIIKSVENYHDSMTIIFGKHDTSILAGGSFAPKIKIHHTENNWINLDIENTFINDEVFIGLLESTIVTSVDISEYTGLDNSLHKIIKFKLNEKYSEYFCEFLYDTDSNDDFMSLQINLK